MLAAKQRNPLRPIAPIGEQVQRNPWTYLWLYWHPPGWSGYQKCTTEIVDYVSQTYKYCGNARLLVKKSWSNHISNVWWVPDDASCTVICFGKRNRCHCCKKPFLRSILWAKASETRIANRFWIPIITFNFQSLKEALQHAVLMTQAYYENFLNAGPL